MPARASEIPAIKKSLANERVLGAFEKKISKAFLRFIMLGAVLVHPERREVIPLSDK